MTGKKRKRMANAREIMETKFRPMGFEGEMLELFGDPEMSGCWIIWGESGNGKTSCALKLVKYLTKFGKVLYDTIEEGISLSFKNAIEREGMLECNNRFFILDKEPLTDLEARLVKRKSPDIIFVDSVQYSGLNKLTAKALTDKFPRKLFVFISHASGKLPDGRTANAIRYDANVKIMVRGYQAKIQSRYGGDKTKTMIIWREGADNYGKI